MVIKINYTSSDVYVSTSVSPVYVVVNYSAVNNGSGSVWGSITGTLSDQTDLQNALNAKFDDPTGTASQYVRGDGQLANFPDNGGGGSSVNYYLNGSVTQGTFGGTTYYEMSKTPVLGAGTNFTRTNAQGNGYIASFITDAGDPSLLNIPGGNWNVEFYFASSASGGSPQFYGELYKVSSADVFTLVASGSTNPEGITNGTTVDQYFTSIPVPQTSLLVTDRLAIRIYVIPSGRTITLHTENSNLCEVITTFSTGLNALNGLTSQVQYFATGTSGTDFAINSATDTHTFNLPTASATNRGALSSADWSTFSGKVAGSGTSGQVAYWNGTSSQTGSNNLFWDAANSRLGIGLTNPAYGLDVSSTVRFSSSTAMSTGYSFAVQRLQFNNGVAGGNIGIIRASTDGIMILNNAAESNFTRLCFGAASTSFPGLQRSGLALCVVDGAGGTLGNLIVGGTTDGGQRLQVQGDAFIKGSGATSATTALTVQNSNADSLLTINNAGTATFRNNLIVSTIFGNGGNLTLEAGSGASVIRFKTFANSSGYVHINNPDGAFTPASGNIQSLVIDQGFAPTSGTATMTYQRIQPTINQTGGANGITRGLYINPTLTAAADWRAIEVVQGVSVLAPSTTASATLRIPSGTAPTSPVNGDIWFDGTDLKIRVAGVTRTIVLL
jgi:hypothetical protein